MIDMSREEAIERLKRGAPFSELYFEDWEKALEMGIEALENQKTGHWINKKGVYGVVYCSECDYELHTNNTNYCANCGAKMEGENKDNWFAEMEESEKHYEHKKWVESLEKGEQE